MSDAGNGIWTITKQIAPYTGNYTFLNGNCGDWTARRTSPAKTAPTAHSNDRAQQHHREPRGQHLLRLECWTAAAKNVPEGGPTTHVTFSVNTDNITVGTERHVRRRWIPRRIRRLRPDRQRRQQPGPPRSPSRRAPPANWVFFNSPTHGGDWGTKEDLAGLDCGDPANYNDRFLPAVTAPTTEEYCFGTCDAACSAPPPPATTYNVTFRVDMNNFDGDFGVVNINGSFNGWWWLQPLSDDDADGVYEVTLPLEEGTIEYKFTLDGWSQQEEFQPGGSCTSTIDGFTNRPSRLRPIPTCLPSATTAVTPASPLRAARTAVPSTSTARPRTTTAPASML